MLQAAQRHWEFILVDSAPLLVANDTAELARAANGVVVLARSGRTTVDAAERTAEQLRRIEAPVLGIVLIAANESPTAYRYYRKGLLRRHRGAGPGPVVAARPPPRQPRCPRSPPAPRRPDSRRQRHHPGPGLGSRRSPVPARPVMTDAPVWVRAPLPWRASLGSFVVATAADERVLEGSAAAVWELLETPRTKAQLLAVAAELFDLEGRSTGEALAALADADLCRPT